MKQKYTVLQESINGETGAIYWLQQFENFEKLSEAREYAYRTALVILKAQEYSVSQVTGDQVVLITKCRQTPVMQVLRALTVEQARIEVEDWKNSYK